MFQSPETQVKLNEWKPFGSPRFFISPQQLAEIHLFRSMKKESPPSVLHFHVRDSMYSGSIARVDVEGMRFTRWPQLPPFEDPYEEHIYGGNRMLDEFTFYGEDNVKLAYIRNGVVYIYKGRITLADIALAVHSISDEILNLDSLFPEVNMRIVQFIIPDYYKKVRWSGYMCFSLFRTVPMDLAVSQCDMHIVCDQDGVPLTNDKGNVWIIQALIAKSPSKPLKIHIAKSL